MGRPCALAPPSSHGASDCNSPAPRRGSPPPSGPGVSLVTLSMDTGWEGTMDNLASGINKQFSNLLDLIATDQSDRGHRLGRRLGRTIWVSGRRLGTIISPR